ncbi:MAG: pyridoxal-phosphate dependent enzyme [Tepidisphaeraceae bacterium]
MADEGRRTGRPARLFRRLALSRVDAVLAHRGRHHHGRRGPYAASAGGHPGPARGHEPASAVPAIRRPEPVRQLQRQRYDRRVHARAHGRARRVACASTGNTSASLALYASFAEIEGIVFIGSGKIAFGKLSQALDYGAKTLQISGDFDACLHRVKQIAVQVPELGIYLMNSVNPFRLEGQKSIMFRILEAMTWDVPDWIVVPGGNLGNCSAFGKAFKELLELGLIKRAPRLAVINAAGANTLHEVYNGRGLRWNDGKVDCEKLGQFYGELNEAGYKAHTIASAIEIGRPVNLPKALRRWTR